ncbi:hypothetical protein BDV93DRAFT_541449 [Ceratobasidium sp. AG-I]|nr:hypothetical protein BDV93DRAFT_541449 [Ceratobasidium sp. AG-I]
MIIIPILALSALFKLTNPDVTLSASRTPSIDSVAHHGTEHVEVGLEYPSLSQVFQPSLPGQSPLRVGRGLQLGSPVDLSLCSVPLPTPTRKFSSTSRAVTHESGTLNHKVSTNICGAVCRLLAFKVPSASLLSSSSSFSPSSSLSTPNLHLHGSFNTTSALNGISSPVYGPEWEWSPRDLIVYVPQPTCPVPVPRSDMSTLPTLHRCTPSSQYYYAEVIRVAMLNQTSVVSRLGWCGRGSEALQAALKQAAIARYELARRKSACQQEFIVKSNSLGNDLDSREVKKKVSSARDPLACANAPEPFVPSSSQTPVEVPSQPNVKYYVKFYAPRRRVRTPFVPQPIVETRTAGQEVVKFYPPQRHRTVLPSQPQPDSHSCLTPERPNDIVDTIVQGPSAESSGSANEVEARLKDVRTTQPEQDNQIISGEKVQEKVQEEEAPEEQGQEEPNTVEGDHQEEGRVKLAPPLLLPLACNSSLPSVSEVVVAKSKETPDDAPVKPFDWADDAQEELEKSAVNAQLESDEPARQEGTEQGEKERQEEREEEQEEQRRELELMESEEQVKARRLAAWKAMGGGTGWVASLTRGDMPVSAEEGEGESWTVVQRKKCLGPNQMADVDVDGGNGGGSGGGKGGRNGKGQDSEASTKVAGYRRH